MKGRGSTLFRPIFLYPLVGLLTFWPCLVSRNAYFDGDLLAYYFPTRIYLKACITQGHFPLWCPFLLGGQPFFADPNVMASYPFTYLLLPLPITYGFTLFYFLHFLLAAGGMYFWLGVLGLSRGSRLIGGLLFALSGFFGWEIIHPPLFAAFAWMPWWGGMLEKVSEKLKPIWGFAAGLVFALIFLSGHFQMTLAALYGGVIYLGFRLLTRRDWRKEPNKDSRLLLTPLFFLWGALPLLLLWIPAREFIHLSQRFNASHDYETFQADFSLDPRTLVGFLFPVNSFNGPGGQARPLADYLVNAGYLGPWALFLMAMGSRQRKPLSLFLATASVLAVLIAFGKYFPLHRLLCLLAPGFEWMRAPFRYLCLFALGGSLLSSIGFEGLERAEGAKGSLRGKIRMGAVLYGIALLILAFTRGKESVPQLPAILAGGAGLYLWMGTKRLTKMGKQIFLVSLGLSLVATAWLCRSSRWGPADNFAYEAKAPVLAELKKEAGLGRVLIGDHIPYPVEADGEKFQSDLPADSAYASEVRNAIGYNPLSLDKISDLYTLSLGNYVRLMAVKVFAAGDNRWELQGFSKEDWRGAIFGRNQNPASFIYAPGRVETVEDDQQRLALMRAADYNPYETTYFSERIPEGETGQMGKSVSLKYGLKRDEPDEEVFNVLTGRPGWVVFSEVMYPGWKAWVDEKPTRLFTANHTFRSVWVGSGNHEVTFRYEPIWLKPLLFGFGLWVLSVFVLLLGPWRKSFIEEFQKI